MENKKKYVIISVVAIVILTAIVVGCYYCFFYKEPVVVAKDPVEMESAEIRKYFGSQEFAQLPIQEKVRFFESIPENKRRSLMRPPQPPKEGELPQRPNQNMMQQMRKIREYQMEQHLNKFFTASEAEQNRMLDEDITKMQKMRSEMNQRRAEREKQRKANAENNNGGKNGNNENNRPQRPQMNEQARRDMEASMNPATRAKMRVYMEKMRQREQQKQQKK